MQKQNEITKTHNQAEELQESLQSGIEHLGHQNESVRIGGIYELYNLAKDHEEQRKTVQDILCAHVRSLSNDDDYAKKYHKGSEQDYQVAEEIRTILNILCSREKDNEGRAIFESSRVDFKGALLQGADLQGANLQGAKLQKIDLQEAKLQEAHLQVANLSVAKLQGVHLQEAHLKGAHLQGANLKWVKLGGTHLEEANLQGANLQGVELQWLQRLDLEGAIINPEQIKGLPNGWQTESDTVEDYHELYGIDPVGIEDGYGEKITLY